MKNTIIFGICILILILINGCNKDTLEECTVVYSNNDITILVQGHYKYANIIDNEDNDTFEDEKICCSKNNVCLKLYK